MPAKVTKPGSLLAQAQARSAELSGHWEDTIPQSAEVLEVLRAKVSGELDLSARQLVDLFKSNGIDATRHKVVAAMERMSQKKG